MNQDEFNRCKNFALKKISYSQKTSFDIKKILKAQKYSEENINKTINFLTDYHLIDDETYVKSFVQDKSSLSLWSKNKIFYKLKSKDIPDYLINKYLDNISETEEYEKALNLAEKKSNNSYSLENKQKIYRYLASRGFSFDIISKCVGEIFK